MFISVSSERKQVQSNDEVCQRSLVIHPKMDPKAQIQNADTCVLGDGSDLQVLPGPESERPPTVLLVPGPQKCPQLPLTSVPVSSGATLLLYFPCPKVF